MIIQAQLFDRAASGNMPVAPSDLIKQLAFPLLVPCQRVRIKDCSSKEKAGQARSMNGVLHVAS